MVRDAAALTIRLPRDVREWLGEQAEHNLTTVNAEIVRVVREAMRRDKRRVSRAADCTSGGDDS